MKQRAAGFSLIEIAIVMAIIAVMVGTVISYTLMNTGALKTSATRHKMEEISKALAAFVAINGRLPCPADGSLALNDPLFGAEYCTGSLSASISRPSCTPPCSWVGNEILGGTLPTQALSLTSDYALDAWNNRFTYAVDSGLAVPGAEANFYVQTIGGIIIEDAAHNIRTDKAAYVLISYGPLGYGAWPKNGGTRISDSSAAADVQENAHTAGGWNNIFVERHNEGAGDDYHNYLYYQTKSMIILAAGYKYAGSACLTAQTVISQGAKNLCDDVSANPNGVYPNIYCPSILNDLAEGIKSLCPNW